jgi:hypothetical protein
VQLIFKFEEKHCVLFISGLLVVIELKLNLNFLCGLVETENTAVGIRHADHVAPFIRKSWQSLRRQAAVARSV